MDLYKVMEDRRSVRAYKPDPVPQASVDRILRAAQIAPSWKNRQAWHIINIQAQETIIEIGKILDGNPRGVDFETLPMLMMVAMNPTEIDEFDGKPYYLVDAGIVGEHIVLAAQAEGLGTCWIGWFHDAPLKSLLGIPDPYRIVMVTPLGYPAKETPARQRKDIAAIAHEESW